ncbi:hypothetical protein [Altererythrobacter sp. ZODW24]|uniref:SecDF P1 head subdomain-containing protein n=1 Tax=Altererythrobacter sp. ZODW24 TaxID=2185142 RepID=UPI0013B45DEA|nr:hypothetical protein [Altererythrobacter sp. ZODW24]
MADLPLCADTVDDASIEVVEMRRFDGNDYFLNLRLTPEAGRKFAEMTAAMVGEELPIMLAGEVLISPRVNEPILGGTLQISGGKEELERALEALDEACR